MGEFFLFCTLCYIKGIFLPDERTGIDQTDIRKLENRTEGKTKRFALHEFISLPLYGNCPAKDSFVAFGSFPAKDF